MQEIMLPTYTNYTTVLILVIAYLLGSIPFGVVFSKLFGSPDPRSYGSKNIGATNVLRSGNKILAFLTLAGDLAKGFIAVKLAYFSIVLGFKPNAIYLVAIATFLGHLFPIFLKFKGGKGVAVAAGILLAFIPQLGVMAIIIWLLIFTLSKVSALAALGAASFVFTYALLFLAMPAKIVFILIAVLLAYRHQENISRILKTEELKINI